MLDEGEDCRTKMNNVASDDGKRYDFDFHALSKVKRREKLKIYTLLLVVCVLTLALVAMVVLYHGKTQIKTRVVHINSSSSTDELIKAKIIAYKRIAKYGEDCHSTSKKHVNCGANAFCRYLQGTYRCDCKTGYAGDGVGDCKDVHFSINFKNPTINNIPEVKRVHFPSTDQISTCFWYKLSETRQKWLSAFMYTTTEIPGTNDLMIWFTTNQIHVTFKSQGQIVYNKTLPKKQWTHFCWLWESTGKWMVYLNGKNVNAGYVASKKKFIGTFPGGIGSFLLGQDKDEDTVNEPKQMFRGTLTQFFLYHKKLSEDEIFSAFENRPSTQNVTVGWWDFKNKTKGTDIIETEYPFDKVPFP